MEEYHPVVEKEKPVKKKIFKYKDVFEGNVPKAKVNKPIKSKKK